MIWYMPHNASGLLREMGIVLIIIAVSLLAGDGFFVVRKGDEEMLPRAGNFRLTPGGELVTPPLVFTGAQADEAVSMLDEALTEVGA